MNILRRNNQNITFTIPQTDNRKYDVLSLTSEGYDEKSKILAIFFESKLYE